MSTVLSPIISEFETIEQENSYNEWLRTKWQQASQTPVLQFRMTK